MFSSQHCRRGTRCAHTVRAALQASALILSLALSAILTPVHAQHVPIADSAVVGKLKEVILRTNAELAARRAALQAAQARLRAAGFAAPAQLAGEIEEVPSGVNLGDAHSVRLEVSREFLPSGLRSARRALAEWEVERARLELELAVRRIMAHTDQLLTRILAAAAIAQRLSAEDSLLTAVEEALRARFAVGDARYVDVLRLRTERLHVQTDAAAALTDGRISRHALLALLDTRDTTPAAVLAAVDAAIIRELRDPLGAPLPPAPDLDSLVALAGAIRLADIDVSRAEAARRLVRAGQQPLIVASLGAQRFAADDGGYTVGPTVGASVSLPFTARRANRAATVAAESEIVAIQIERRATFVSVRANVSAARDRYEAARERLALYDAALLRGARDEREGALAAYRSGQLSLIELLDFERALARAEIARLRSRMEAADALADLITGATNAADRNNDERVLRQEDDR